MMKLIPKFNVGDEVVCLYDLNMPKIKFKIVGLNISDVISYDCLENCFSKTLTFNETTLEKA